MAVNRLQGFSSAGYGGGTSNTMTPGSAFTAGSLIEVWCIDLNSSNTGFSVGATGLTFTQVATITSGGGNAMALFVAPNAPATAPTITVSGTPGGSQNIGCVGTEYSGVATTSPVVQHGQAGNTFNPSTVTLTGTVAGNLISCASFNNGGSTSTASTFSSGTGGAGTNDAYTSNIRAGDWVASVGGSVTGTQTTSSSYLYTDMIMAEYAAGGGGGGSPPNPSAFFSDRGYGKDSARGGMLFATANIPNPATFQPPPPSVFADRGYGVPNHQLDWATPKWTDPAIYRPNPSAVFADRGFGSANRLLDVATPKWIDPAGFRPTPSASFVDRGYAAPNRQLDVSTPKWVDPANFRPSPDAVYPDSGRDTASPAARGMAWTATIIQAAAPTSNPSAIFSDEGYGTPFRQHDAVTPKWVDPATFRPNPSAVFADRGNAAPFRQLDVATPQWLNPALYQPIPGAVFADHGYGQPATESAHLATTYFVAVPPAVPPSAAFPDRGYSVANRPPEPSVSRWIDPSSFRPNPESTYSDRGYGVPNPLDVHVFTTTFLVVNAPPPQQPLAVFVDRGYAVASRPADPVAAQWINPATFQPSPIGSFPARGYGVQSTYAAHVPTTPYVQPPAGPNPSAVFADRGYAIPNRQLDVSTPQWINPATFQPKVSAVWSDHGYGQPANASAHVAVTPYVAAPVSVYIAQSVFSDRGLGSPNRQLDYVTPKWTPPIVVLPSAVFSDRGRDTRLPAAFHLASTSQRIDPALFQPNPQAVYADRGFGRPVANGAHLACAFQIPTTGFVTIYVKSSTVAYSSIHASTVAYSKVVAQTVAISLVKSTTKVGP